MITIPKGQSGIGTSVCADHWAYFDPFLPRSAAMSKSSQEGCPSRSYVKSFGPNAEMTGLCGSNGDDCTLRYDPTNGLRSIGDIAVFVPGVRIE